MSRIEPRAQGEKQEYYLCTMQPPKNPKCSITSLGQVGHTFTSDYPELVFEQWCHGDSADWFFQSHLLDSAAKRGQLFKVAKKLFCDRFFLAIFSPSFFELFCPNHNRLTMWSFQSDRMSWRNLVHFLFFAKI